MIYNQQQWNNVNIQNYNQFRVASQSQANNYEKDLDKVIAQRNFKYGAFFFDLPLFVTKEIIYQHLLKFFNYQSILQIVVPKDHSSGLSKQMAFIQLESFEESLLFRKKINHTQIYGHSLKVGIIAADEKPNSKDAEDLVLGIPSQIDDISSEKDDKPSDQIVLNSQYSKRNKNYTEVLVLDIPSEIDHQTFDQIISDSQYKNVLKVNLFDDPYNILIQDEKSQKFNSCYIQFDRLKVAMKFEKAVTSKQFQLGQRKSDQVWEEVKNEALGDYVEGKVISLRCYVDPITNQNILLQDYERVLKDDEVNDEVAEQKMVEEVQQRLQDYFKGFKILSSLVKISPVFKQPRVYLCFQTMEEYKNAMKMLEEEKDRMKGMNKMNAIGEKNQEGGQQQSKSDAAELQIKASGFNFTCQLMHRKELWKERELYRDGKCIFMKNLKRQIIDTDTNQLVDLNGEILKRVLEKKVLPNSKKLEVVSCQVKSSEYHNTNYAIVFLSEGNHIQEVKNFAKETGSDLNKLFEKEAAYVNILHHKVFHKDHTQKKRNRDLQGTLLQNKNTNNMFRSLTQQQIFQQQAQFMVPPGMNFPPNLGFMPPSNPLLQGMPPGMPFPQFQRPFVPFAMGPNLIYQQPPFQQPLGFRPQYQPPFNPQQSRVNNNFNNNNFSNAPYNSNNNYNNQQANRNPIFQQRNTQSQAPQRFNNYNNNNNNHNNNSNNFQQPNQNRRPPQQNSTYPQQQNQASRPITQNNNFQNRNNNNNLPQNNNNTNQQRRPNTQQTNIQPATRAQGVPVPLNRQPIQVNAVPLPINLPIRPGQPPVQQKPPQQQK